MIKKLIKDGSLYTLSGFISRGISLILLPFYVRFLTQEEYGLLDLILLLVNFVNITFSLELTQAIARFLPSFRFFKPKVHLISTSLWILVGSYSFFFLSYMLFKEFIISNVFQVALDDSTYCLIGVYVVLNGLFLFFQNNLRWDLQSFKFSINSLIYTFFNVAFVVLFLFNMNLGINGVLVANIIASIVAVTASFISHRKYYTFFISRKYARKLIYFSFPLIFSSVSVYLSLYIDRIIINQYLGLSELAIFGVSYRFASLVGLITLGFSSALTPLIYNSPYAFNTKNTLAKLFYFFLLGSFLFLFFITLFATDILLIFTTVEYVSAKYIMPVVTASVIFSSLYIFFPGLTLEGRTKILAVINTVAAALNLILCLILVKKYGVFGVAISTLITAIFSFMINVFYSNKFYEQKISKPIIFKIIGLSLLSFIISYFISIKNQSISAFNEFFLLKIVLFFIISGATYWILFDKIKNYQISLDDK
ncbi:oligosaccharide flippase family protein [Algoriphagus jejuensis]